MCAQPPADRPAWMPSEACIESWLEGFGSGAALWWPAEPEPVSRWWLEGMCVVVPCGAIAVCAAAVGLWAVAAAAVALAAALVGVLRRAAAYRSACARPRRGAVDPSGIIEISANTEWVVARFGDRELRERWCDVQSLREAVQGVVIRFDDGAEFCLPTEPGVAPVERVARHICEARARFDEPLMQRMEHGLSLAEPEGIESDRGLSLSDDG